LKRLVTYGPRNNRLEIAEDLMPSADEVVVAVKAVGICGSDIAIHRGPFPGRLTLPRVLGHEWSGQVLRTGKSVQNFKEGDRIVSEEIFWCGYCTACREGNYDHCANPPELGFTVDGAFSTQVCLPERYCHKLPDNISFKIGAMIEPLSVAYNAVSLADFPLVSKKIIVIGLGPIGLSVGLWAKASGAAVIGIEPRSYRQQIAHRLGISSVINVDPKTCEIQESDLLQDIDVIVEASGSHWMVTQLIEHVRPKGNIILVSHSMQRVQISLETIVLQGLKIIGSCGQVGRNTYTRVIRSLAQGVIDPTLMITHEYKLDDISDALEMAISTENYGKIMIIND